MLEYRLYWLIVCTYLPSQKDELWLKVATMTTFLSVNSVSLLQLNRITVFHSVLDLIKAWEHFTDHHPRIVSRVAITCIMLELWFIPKHQIPYRRHVGWYCKQNAPVKFDGWKASMSWCRFTSLFVGFLPLGKNSNTSAYTWCFPRWCTGVELGMANGDQC